MWALNTCGEPNEIELTAAHVFFYRSVSGPPIALASLNGTWMQDHKSAMQMTIYSGPGGGGGGLEVHTKLC